MNAGRNRPERLVVVAGTATEIGKTWVAAGLARALRADGVTVAARKPVQSFAPDDDTTDAHRLAEATGEDVHTVCPPHRWYEVAMAPPMAAEVLARPAFTIGDLVDELVWPTPPPAVGLVEPAGGTRAPLADDGDTVSLVDALRPDLVVLVADAGLGTLNAVRLCADAFAHATSPPPLAVHLNRFDERDDLHRRNRDWLAERDGLDVVTSTQQLTRRALGGVVGTS